MGWGCDGQGDAGSHGEGERSLAPLTLLQPDVAAGRSHMAAVWARGLIGDAGRAFWWHLAPTWSCTSMVMQMLFFSSLQLSGGDAECSCDEGDETSRKKRSRSL